MELSIDWSYKRALDRFVAAQWKWKDMKCMCLPASHLQSHQLMDCDFESQCRLNRGMVYWMPADFRQRVFRKGIELWINIKLTRLTLCALGSMLVQQTDVIHRNSDWLIICFSARFSSTCVDVVIKLLFLCLQSITGTSIFRDFKAKRCGIQTRTFPKTVFIWTFSFQSNQSFGMGETQMEL